MIKGGGLNGDQKRVRVKTYLEKDARIHIESESEQDSLLSSGGWRTERNGAVPIVRAQIFFSSPASWVFFSVGDGLLVLGVGGELA